MDSMQWIISKHPSFQTCLPASTPMKLTVIAGPDLGRIYDLADCPAVVLGRGTEATNPLTDGRVSRKHCLIEAAGGNAVVKDNESRGGTFVNNQAVKTAVLKPGDVIRIGETELRFHAATGEVDATTMSPEAKVATEVSDDLSPLVGKTLHHYRLERILAQGKSGTVFYAKHKEQDRELAVKVLRPSITRVEEETQRFIRAMKTMLPLQHPNIVRLYNAGKHGPYCWLAMEYVEGECLTETIQRIGTAGMLDWQYAFRVAVHVARALEAAAEQHIIHRNVCPRNILFRTSDKVVKLGDLMLAKAFEGLQVEQITRPGELIGDVAYMAPERTAGAQDVDARSDIYGLGATLYAVLTGRPPFEDRSLPALIGKIRRDNPVPPKTFQLSINDMFEGIVLRMLAKRPEDRFLSAADLLKDLNRVAKFQGISV